MKHLSTYIVLLLTLVSISVSAQTTTDATICTAIRNYLLGRSGAAILTTSAKQDLVESTWPEVQCSVSGDLDSPQGFKNLTFKRVAPGKYKYSCVCPIHGDKYADCCTISATLGKDGKVRITHITWDDTSLQSFSDLMNTATWYATDYDFSMPNFFTPSTDIYVEDVATSFQRWTYDEVCMACWPLLGAWAVAEYPDANCYLTEDVKIKNVTYHNGNGTVFSGYANDGRIWYMKKKVIVGREVDHAKVLVLIYPKSKQSDVKPLIDVVKGW